MPDFREPKRIEITEEYLRACLVTKREHHWTHGRWEPWLSVCRPIVRYEHRWFPARGATKEEAEQRALDLAMKTIFEELIADADT